MQMKGLYRYGCLQGPSKRIVVLRALLICSLIVAGVLVAVADYVTLTYLERSFAVSQYNSVTEQAFSATFESLERMRKGSEVMARSYQYSFPNETTWPNVAMPGFYETMKCQLYVSSFAGYFFTPLVLTDQLPSFNKFMYEYWATQPSIPAGSGAPAGPGVWAINGSASSLAKSFYLDDGKVLEYETTHDYMLAPILQLVFNDNIGPKALGYNTHSRAEFGLPLDWMMDCVEGSATYADAIRNCAIVSDVASYPVPTPQDPSPESMGYGSLFFQPVILQQEGPDGVKGKMVGSVTGQLNWAMLFRRAFQSYVTGVDIVVTTDTTTFSYSIDDGKVEFTGIGDHHNSEFSKYAHTEELFADRTIATFTGYTLTFYPRAEFFENYKSTIPIYTSIGALVLILICGAVFALYDVAVCRESTHRAEILDTKRRFVRFISHEIRTPLNTVRLGLQLLEIELDALSQLLTGGSPSDLLQMVTERLTSWLVVTSDILGSSDSAVDVLDDLLNYDKIEMGTLRLEFGAIPIWSLVKKTVAAFVLPAKQRGVTLNLVGDGWQDLSEETQRDIEFYSVVGDSGRISQVLRNLLSNALKFTPQTGQVTISVECDHQGLSDAEIAVPPGSLDLLDIPRAGSIRVSVRDSGAGLSPQQLAEICSEGVQFNANELQAGGGSGLGLFISKGLVEQHGGKLTVASEGLGKGSTFTIELPLFLSRAEGDRGGQRHSEGLMYKPEPPPLSRSSSFSLNSKVFPLSGSDRSVAASVVTSNDVEVSGTDRPKRILVVDDAPSNRKLLMRILQAKGFLCDGAQDGQEAVDLYTALRERGEVVNAILMDYEMPVMDGPTAAKALRELGCDCLIVGITGNVLPADIDYYKRQGANAVLAKPLNIDKFQSIYASYEAHSAVSNVSTARQEEFDPLENV